MRLLLVVKGSSPFNCLVIFQPCKNVKEKLTNSRIWSLFDIGVCQLIMSFVDKKDTPWKPCIAMDLILKWPHLICRILSIGSQQIDCSTIFV